MIYTDPEAAAPAFRAQIDQARRILLLSHINPDGDAIGSLLGAAHALRAIGKEPIALASSPAPAYTDALPGIEQLQVYQPGQPLPEADLVWMLDTAARSRVGPIFTEHGELLQQRPLIIVDHHETNDGGGQLNLIAPAAASTADLLFRLLRAMGLPVSPAAATCLLMGTLTDTHSFQTSSTSPQALRSTAELLEAGASLETVVKAAYFSVPASTVQLSGMALSDLRREGGLFWVTVTNAMMQATGAEDEATDDTVTRMQRIAGAELCVLFKERPDGSVKLSLRSTPRINVAQIARGWGGGGHAQAAGAVLPMGLEQAHETVLPALRAALAAAPAA